MRFLARLVPALCCLILHPAPVQAQSNQAASAVILQYHHVSSTTPPSTSISPADFRVHMEYLRDNGFTVLRLEEVVAALQDAASLPDKTAVITFDDGYLSVYTGLFRCCATTVGPSLFSCRPVL